MFRLILFLYIIILSFLMAKFICIYQDSKYSKLTEAYMFNFLFSYRFCCTFCCIVQILSFNSRVEAKTSHHSNFEFNMDANTIRNCDNLEDKIDCFIDAGMQYQQATSKIFKYKTFLKQAYKHL